MPNNMQSNLTRPLTLKHGLTEVSILVPSDVWVAAEQLREEFLISLNAAPASEGASDSSDDQSAELIFVARFLKFATEKSEQSDHSLQFIPVLKTVFLLFVSKYLKGNDVHAVTQNSGKDTRTIVINAFFSALVFLRSTESLAAGEYKSPTSALFSAAQNGSAKLFAIFGGQGNIEEYFDELADIYATYTTLVQEYVEGMAAVLRELARSDDASVFHSKGLDVMGWLRNPDSKPDLAYLVSAPVSLPLIGLVQLMHYYVMLRVLDKTPDQVRNVIKGSTGHSQGVISSVVISASATYEEFFINSRKALGLLFWIGTRSQEIYPPTTLNPAILQDSLSNNEGNPTPMLVVNQLRASEVMKYVEATNRHLPEDRQIKIALINGPRSVICTGPPQSLYGLNLALRKLKAPSGLEQGRVPFSQRKIKFSSRFLPITAPFHSSYLDGVSAIVEQDIDTHGLKFDHTRMTIPVFSTDEGKNISGSSSITMDLVHQILSLPVHWEKATAMPGSTHVIDFGPGSSSGVGSLTARNKDGTGVQVILAGADEGINRELSYKSDLFDSNSASLRYAPNWASEFQPKLVRSVNGDVHISTRMSRLLAKPPLMVAGMTPSTVNETFVSAVMNAGYHIELAGGGHYNEAAIRSKVKKIMHLTTPGAGITLNTLFINVRQWGFQAPLVPKLRREGLPMEGFCCAAGVPSLEVAQEFITDMHSAGIRHISFKPGSTESIRQVLAIAAAHPEMPIILQWTGGRAGGHHSFEDFHQPILDTYSAIRRHANVVLVAGSGFGGAEDTFPYITGDWSVELGYPAMPFDGILFGSRMMVAKEGMASLGVKHAIVDAPGVDDSEWEKTYKGPTGGVMTVRSELGEPIHKIATRGVRLWKEMDDTIFNLTKDKRSAALLAKKDYIIKRLNADFQKVWFGKKADGSVADLQDMTYEEVINRMIELLYIKHEERWIDHSHRNLLGDVLRRVEERFVGTEKNSIVQTYSQLDIPFDFAQEFINTYPLTKTQLLTTEDVGYFLFLMNRRGQKPVPFIPVLDNDFEVWFKKDSLWQAEDLAAVVDQDVQRTCILQGPAAVRYATKVNEPVKDILDEIFQSHIVSLKQRYYSGEDAQIPQVEYFGSLPSQFETALSAVTPLVKADYHENGSLKTVETSMLESSLPKTEDWLEYLASAKPSWIRALLRSPAVIQGKKFLDNPLARLFRPRVSQAVQFEYDGEKLHTVTVYDRRSWSTSGRSDDLSPSLRARLQPNNLVEVVLVEKNGDRLVPFPLLFHYTPDKGYALIHEVMEGRNERIKEFYYKLWFPSEESQFADCLATDAFTEKFICNGERVNTPEIKEFCQAVGNQAELYVERRQKVVYAPMDFAIVVGWKSIIKAIFPKSIDGDLLKLVHLSNGFRMLDGAEPLKQGDVVDTVAEINAVVNNDSGKLVQVKGVVLREGKRVMEVTSEFLYRGNFTDYHNTFQKIVELPMEVKLTSVKDVAVLKSKEWIQWAEGEHTVGPNASLVFRLNTVLRFKNKTIFSHVETTGTVTMQISTKEHVEIATVHYSNHEETHGNPVLAYLKRHGSPIEQAIHFENGGYSVMPEGSFNSEVISPFSNELYAKVSGDFNPIHVNPYFADLAELPGTITHGMWTSASTRKFVEIFAADNHPQRVTSYEVSFLSMVLPQDRLSTKLSHIGMINGKKIIKVETFNQNGSKVVEGTAEIDQPTIAYVFTGQGSQEQGMGMALYDSSPVAKDIWQRADRHFLENYGFSILDIVRNNPLKKTIHFGGPKGNAIRQNYMSMRYDIVDQSGSIQSLPLFPGINETTHSYTFQSPNGLLAATQFTQPALTLMEKAAFEDMRSKGLIQANCAFAGHSLGEYSALAAIGEVLPIESLVDVVFYRGMTMQVAVPRDSDGRSNYGMVAINPSRVSPTFNDSALRYVVDAIARQSNGLLEIVNENVENWQYVAAGELSNLDALSTVLNFIKVQKIDLQKLMETMPLEEVKKHLSQIITGALEKVAEKLAKDGIIKPERGVATIPLAGIDVPFHSSFLLSGVAPFRTYLAKKINPTFINVPLLTAKYIPNLTAMPFSIEKSYIEGVYSLTSSPRLGKVLKSWVDTKLTAKQQQRLGYTLLVELLAYQFASPVRWIETQDRLFKEYNVVRLIEVGPSPTLCGMAQRTLKFKYEAYDDALTFQRSTLCTSKDTKEIYYALESAEPTSPAPTPSAPAVKAAPTPAPVAAPVAAAAGPASAVADAPIKAVEILHVIVAQKVKKTLDEVPLSKAIKDLVGGKSTLQNEILGDLQKEFGSSGFPEKGEEAPLEELANSLQGNFNGALGKQTTALISKMVGSKLPGGFSLSTAKGYLAKTHGLGSVRADGALLVGLTMEPAARLNGVPEANAWLDTVAQAYARRAGISLGAATPAGAAPVMMSSAPAGAGAPAAIPDAPIKATEVLHVIVAQKIKKTVDEVPLSKAIKDLVGGKSTLQNEILGDLQKEFGGSGFPEKGEEAPLEELGNALQGNFNGVLGKQTTSLIAKMIGSKMPGGFTQSSAKSYLSSSYGLGPVRADAALLLGLTMEPNARLGSEPEAKAWLDTVAQAYARRAGITLGGGGGAAVGGAVGGAVMNSEEFNQFQAKQNALMYQHLEVYARYLEKDLRAGDKLFEEEKLATIRLQADIDQWMAEHGDYYAEGIKPSFSAKKARKYDSHWNWVRQDALSLFYDMIFGRLTAVDREVVAQCIHVMNRANPQFLEFMIYHIDNTAADRGKTYALAKELGNMLIENCREVLDISPVYKDVGVPTGPATSINNRGDILYEEVQRAGIRKLDHYVKDMSVGGKMSEYSNRQKVQKNLQQIYKIIKSQNTMKSSSKLAIKSLYGEVIHSINMSNSIIREEKNRRASRARRSSVSVNPDRPKKVAKKETIPFLHLKKKNPQSESGWEFSQRLTGIYLDVLTNIARDGVTYEDRMVLITGAGKDSIGSAILKGLLSGGAKVVVTTSRFSREVTEYYQSIYQRHGSKNSSLVVVPFNGGSKQDVDALVNYIYDKDPKKGLGWDLDYIIPFAAISVQGKEIDNIDSQSELAHRIMLTNVLRLLGNVKAKKMEYGYDTRPAQVILPLSPNHGTFGADGLYGESKVSLETLFNRWKSESWSAYLTITGAVIGWTRGTGLMSGNNIVAEGLEKYGVRTFSTQEMAFNILGLMHPSIANLCQIEPVWADLNGGLQYLLNLNEISANLRAEYRQTSEIRKAIVSENSLDFKETYGSEAERKHQPHKVTPRANMKFPFPHLKDYKDLTHAHQLRGMLDLEKVVVVTGFGEVGPWGNSRTRWEMEANGQFSLEGCIEMAWIMGYIKHHNGPLKSGSPHSGWVDAKTGEPVKDRDVKAKYEKQILAHTGIRLIEPELFGGYDPERKGLMQEVLIDHDLEPFEVSKEEAQMFKLQHGDKVDIYEEESGQWAVKFKKGANMYVPKALKFDRLVAGQIPTGWNAARYGVPKDIIDQVDTITLYVLVSTVEALIASGITDPYEFYQYVHVSEVGNTAGSGVGGMLSLRGMYRDRMLDKPIQKDILQESFINTMPAWINMLLLSSSGPIKTPVGACATAVESVEIGVDTIQSGKAKIVIVGGYDDFQEEGSYEFANMKATSNTEEEFAHGRTPQEMSRPATSTRSGFMESHGAGIEILMQASLAIQMGVPIYGIVGLTNTATDKEGRSVPAPGQGVLTTAREVKGKMPSRLLDIKYRKRQIESRRAQIKQWVEDEYAEMSHELEELKANNALTVTEEEYLTSETERIQKEAGRQHREALNLWGNQFYRQDPQIAPLRGALAAFGLTIDDIGVGSFHGTSTKANDKNESDVVNKQLEHLGRSKGNALPSVWQKYLTGHPKGAAAAWMMNGVLQVLQTGLIPGNRNADNIDDAMRKFEHVLYTSRSIQTDGVKAGLLKSFGFGQVGGEVLLIHSDYVLGALEEHEYESYKAKHQARQAKAYRYLHDSMTGGPALVQVKNAPPYTPELESPVYLNPSARAQYNKATKSWAFNAKALVPADDKVDVDMTRAILQKSAAELSGQTSSKGVGVDVEMVSAINIENQNFLERNFTEQEIQYCLSRPDPQSSFAGRWSAKEAVVKAVSSFSLDTEKVWTQGAGAGLKEIEIVMAESGAPSVVFSGAAQEAAAKAGVKEIKVSISHSGAYAVAVANAV
ncbi:3-oxoacyl-[acyl-carrier-protein] synthase [Entomortierella beljakovae]|nr:3-oxoacyl-[acyl-carrier-protein] synthase [Entomortierella beljakovae]